MKEFLPPKNIIVRMPNWIGDLIMATPILKDLKKAFPDSHLTVMCRSPLGDLLCEDPMINELFSFKKVSGFGRHCDRRNIIEKLRKGNYDLGVLLTRSFSSAWWFWQGRVRNRIGYKGNLRRFFLTQAVPFPKNLKQQHLVSTYKMLLKPLEIPVSDTKPYLVVQQEEKAAARKSLEKQGIAKGTIIGINPGAAYGSAKCWLPERFREVTERFLEDENISVVYFGDQNSSLLVKQICQGFSSRVLNLAGMTSLRELMSLINICDVLLTNDSGPMHIADALGTPLVALFGSTNEIITGPYNSKNVIHKHVSCSPCYQRTCPLDFRCMKEIGVDEVYNEVYRLLKTKSCKLNIC